MGDQRHYEDSYPRHGVNPKLMVTGRLRGTCDGRPVEIEAVGRALHLCVPDLRTAWSLRSSVSATTEPLLRSLARAGLGLRLRIGTKFALGVLPKPNLALRIVSPLLRSFSPGAER
jgi:hypothetical protein